MRLNTGQEISQLGFGTWKSSKEDLYKIVVTGYNLGYRTIDTASHYKNLKEIGAALCDIDRSKMFITSKLWSDCRDNIPGELEDVLTELRTNAIDCYFMHFPVEISNGFPKEEYLNCYSKMERLLETQGTRSLGVSNFTAKKLRTLLEKCDVPPAIVQNEFNPYFQDRKVLDLCKEYKIGYMAYSNFRCGKDNMLGDPVLTRIARKYSCTSAQVVLSWLKQKEILLIPKTDKVERLQENCVFVELSEEDHKAIDDLNRNDRSNTSLRIFGIDVFND